MSKPKTSPDRRRGDLAMIHMAAKRLFGDVSKGSDGRADYEAWLHRHTGRKSAGDLSPNERITLIKDLRRQGLIPDRAKGGSAPTLGGEERPTTPQWNKIGGLARSMGWERGLEDERLRAFVTRTAKIASTRFLTRRQASAVILGLEEWVRQSQEKAEETDDAVS